jgi:hypothetical protein
MRATLVVPNNLDSGEAGASMGMVIVTLSGQM